MANMSYCRFENTLSDLKDCYDSMDETNNLGFDESKARRRLLLLCRKLADEYSREIEREVNR